MQQATHSSGERRRSQRIRLSAPAVLHVEGRRIAAHLEDVSRGGAFLRLEEEVAGDRGLSWLSIPFGRDPEEFIVGLFRIVHAARAFMRVEWEERLAPEDWIKLRQLRERQFGTLTVVRNRPLPMLIWPNARSKRGSASE